MFFRRSLSLLHQRFPRICSLIDYRHQVMMSYNALGGTGEKAVKSMLKSMRDEHASRTAELQKDLKRVQGAREAVRGLAANITSLKNVDELARALDKLKL